MKTDMSIAKKNRYEAWETAMTAYANAFADELKVIVSIVDALRNNPEGLTAHQIEAMIGTADCSEITSNLIALKKGASRFQKPHDFNVGARYSGKGCLFMGVRVPDLYYRHFSCEKTTAYRATVYFDNNGNVLPSGVKESYETRRWFYKA